ncbi:hypothetical protein, partial [Desulfosarcina cetonica]|uniref:hypothetical protein n=1 Tax=Desulfosarcina cetonica TaxID=90730 RepID=UPI000ABA7293
TALCATAKSRRATCRALAEQMKLSDEIAKGLGVALNESSLLGVEYSDELNCASATFSILTLPNEKDSEPPDSRIQMIFHNVGRIAASLRNGYWNDYDADIEKFKLNELLSVVQSFGGQPIYGWNFFNILDEEFFKWSDKLSLDFRNRTGSEKNQISLFQEGATFTKHLDLWIWFESLSVHDAMKREIEISSLINGGKRWWDAMHRGDKRTDGHGIYPSKS